MQISIRNVLFVICSLLVIGIGQIAHGYSFIVAASNSTPEAKNRADFVCNGVNDQIELRDSILSTQQYTLYMDTSPAGRRTVTWHGHYDIEWLPGDYYLDETLYIPSSGAAIVNAEGTYFHYQPTTGDAVVIEGMIDYQINLGTIESSSTGAALAVISGQMSQVSFTGLVGHNQVGTGLYIGPGQSTNRYDGTDISGFDTGMHMMSLDTQWYLINSIRRCNTCVKEDRSEANSNTHVFRLGLDTSLPNSLGIHNETIYGKYDVMMSDSSGVGTQALIITPGMSGNVFEFHPPIEEFDWENNSGNVSNVILSTLSPPYQLPVVFQVLAGDFDLNGRVELLDFVILASSWLSEAVTPSYWNLTEEWSETVNPNGVWSYNDDNDNPITTRVDDWVMMHSAGQPAWAPSNSEVPGWAKIDGDCFDWADLPIGCIDTHGPSSLTWTAPRDDTILIDGGVWVGPDRGRTVNWSILHNGSTLTGESINHGSGSSNSPFPFSAGTGGSEALVVNVNAGDIIKFDIGGGEHTGIETTIIDIDNPNLKLDSIIDFQDFAYFAAEWLKETSQ